MQLAKLDLRTRESALAGGAHGPALVPGNAEQSRLFRRIAGARAAGDADGGRSLDAGADRARSRRGSIRARSGTHGHRCAASAAERAGGARAHGHHARAAQLLGVQAAGAGAAAAASPTRISPIPIDRFLEKARVDRGLKAAPRADRRTLVRRAYLDLLGLPPTPAQVAAFVADDAPDAWERLDRQAARLAALRRALRPALARRGALRRLRRLRVRRASAQRVALSRLRHQVVQRRQALQPVPHRADRRRRDGLEDRPDAHRHRLPAHGPARAVPRERQSRAPLRLPRRDHRHHRQGHAGADRQLRALPQPQVRSDFGRRTTTRSRRRSSATSKPRCRWRRAPRPRRISRRTTEIDAKLADAEGGDRGDREAAPRSPGARADSHEVPRPHLPGGGKAGSRAHAGREAAGDPGLRSRQRSARRRSTRCCRPRSSRRRRTWRRRSRRSSKQRPAPLPMAEIATDGDHRFSPLGEGDDIVSCPKCRIPPPFPGSYVHKDGKYQVPPSYFLIRGDRGEPRLADEAGLHRRRSPTAIRRR